MEKNLHRVAAVEKKYWLALPCSERRLYASRVTRSCAGFYPRGPRQRMQTCAFHSSLLLVAFLVALHSLPARACPASHGAAPLPPGPKPPQRCVGLPPRPSHHLTTARRRDVDGMPTTWVPAWPRRRDRRAQNAVGCACRRHGPPSHHPFGCAPLAGATGSLGELLARVWPRPRLPPPAACALPAICRDTTCTVFHVLTHPAAAADGSASWF